MQPKSGKPPRSARLATPGVELSRAAQVRLAWMDFHRRTQNVARTCRHFGISRQTFYRWLKRYEPLDLTTLAERSHCLHQRRRPTWSFLLGDRRTSHGPCLQHRFVNRRRVRATPRTPGPQLRIPCPAKISCSRTGPTATDNQRTGSRRGSAKDTRLGRDVA